MMRRLYLPIVALVSCSIVLTGLARGSEYGAMRDAAASGAAELLDSFLAASKNLDAGSEPVGPFQEEDFIQLMEVYSDASGRDPLGDLLAIFPVADRGRVEEFRSTDEGDLLQILSISPAEEDILAIALARSPRLERAESGWRASLDRYPQTIFLQDLLARYQSFTEGMSLGIGNEYQRDMIQMHVPALGGSGMLGLRGRVVELDAESAYVDYLREGRDVIADARTLLAEIRNSDDLIAINSASVSRLAVLKSVTEAQYVSGTRSFSDLTRIGTELSSRRDMLARMGSMRRGLVAQLLSMLEVATDATIGQITWAGDATPEIDAGMLAGGLVETRQELRQLALGVEKMDAMIEMTGIMATPDRTLGMSYYQGRDVESLVGLQSTGVGTSSIEGKDMGPSMDDANASMDGGTKSMEGIDMGGESPEMSDMSGTSFMNRPMLDFRQTNYAGDFAWGAELVDRRDAMAGMLDAENDMALGMLGMLTEKYAQMLNSEGVYAGRIIPEANAALSVVRTGYVANENDFNDLISSELALLMARMDLADIQLERRNALIEIERLIGRSIGSEQTNER